MQCKVFKVVAVLSLMAGSSHVLRAEDAPTAASPANAKTSSGTFKIDGQTYDLPHVVAYQTKVFDDDGIAVLFCAKEIPVQKLKAALIKDQGRDDSFNLFEPQVKVTFKKTGEPSYSNSWAANSSISVSGGGLKGQLAVKNGRAVGQASMETGDKPEDKKSFDIRFDVPLLTVDIPKADPKPESKPDESDKPRSKSRKSRTKNADKARPAATAGLNVYELPLPDDATNVEYKKSVEHLGYKSPSSVTKVTDFLVKQLEAGDWKSDDSDLTTPQTAILKREKGNANLTIFVKPDGKGSKVTIMTEGLSWEELKKPDAETKKAIE